MQVWLPWNSCVWGLRSQVPQRTPLTPSVGATPLEPQVAANTLWFPAGTTQARERTGRGTTDWPGPKCWADQRPDDHRGAPGPWDLPRSRLSVQDGDGDPPHCPVPLMGWTHPPPRKEGVKGWAPPLWNQRLGGPR